MKCANALTILSRLMPSRGMMRMVSSPAIVPKISCEACVSMSDAIPMAYPGRVPKIRCSDVPKPVWPVV